MRATFKRAFRNRIAIPAESLFLTASLFPGETFILDILVIKAYDFIKVWPNEMIGPKSWKPQLETSLGKMPYSSCRPGHFLALLFRQPVLSDETLG